ncbi:hypothetical protein IG631_19926 [Alternaria alternata]|nr:hypothetical protein IG631_19926 [Alternaria alternata]
MFPLTWCCHYGTCRNGPDVGNRRLQPQGPFNVEACFGNLYRNTNVIRTSIECNTDLGLRSF